MENEVISTNPSMSSIRYPVTQELIDDILNNELKDFNFPVKPIYNSRIRANGITKGEIYKWGQLKRIVSIEIGKQDKPDRAFIINTMLHEYYEAFIMEKQFNDDFYTKLYKSGDKKRHEWIDEQINTFFKDLEENI